MLLILQILETASLNETIRMNLSEKKKIKDLFLVVIRSIQVNENKLLVSSLIQFISNLCYGQGRLRQMLAKEEQTEFVATLKQILVSIRTKREFDADQEGEDQKENADP
mmetsp:Transcript_12716/g.21425  ORF Transcript_12716/g.21425 Transcript_12716/m.21425 type:complete len:109 (-) Transcript_12716:909-1235(-)